MAQNSLQMPGVFGGLMRYDEEYQSRFMLTPTQVIGLVVAIILFVLVLKFIFPIAEIPATTTPIPGLILPFFFKQKL